MQNYTIKDEKKKLVLKPRLHSQSREGAQQQQQPRIAIQNTTVYRNTTADKHRKHSVDNQKQVKKKKKKVQKNIQCITSLNQALDKEEEERLLLEEQKRLRDLEEFQKQQWEKMSAEERERLQKEENDRQTIEMLWDKQLHERKKQQQEIDQWKDYVQCNIQPNPRVEKDLNTFLYQVSNMDSIAQLIESLKVAHHEDLTQSLYQKQEHYYRYIEKLKSIQNEKIHDLTKSYIAGYENFLDELNQTLKQYFMLEFTPETQQRILQKLAQKPEERSKYEILKTTEYNKQFRLGFWYCPLQKIGYRIKPVEFNIYNLAIEIPRQLAGQSLIYKLLWTHHDPFTNYKTYNQYLPIGGVFQTACLPLPKLSKKRNQWTLKPTFDETLLHPIKLNSGFQPYSCFYQISKEYFLQDATKLFIVTYQNDKWTQDGIEDLKINLETRQVSFNLKNQLPFMMATHRFVDFPFKSWKVSSISPERVHLRIQTQRNIDIQIELNQQFATLISPQELAKKFPEPINIVELLVKLREIGVNLIAQEEDAVCLGTVFKMSELENQALLNMMQTLRVYSFKNSKWNRKCGADQVIIQFIENPLMTQTFEGDDEFQWRHLEFQMNKVAMIECSEKSDKLSTKWVKNTVSHANLLILVQQHQISPPELQYYMEEVQNVEFRAHFRTMLKVMRLLSIN